MRYVASPLGKIKVLGYNVSHGYELHHIDLVVWIILVPSLAIRRILCEGVTSYISVDFTCIDCFKKGYDVYH